MSAVVYGLACERTPARTVALESIVALVKARDGMAPLKEDVDHEFYGGIQLAKDAAVRLAARLLPSGEVGGALVQQALTGSVQGL